ncbi:MAG: glycosyltransferase 61 family protein [Cyanobacteriota bacterium]|nr:glycosyltransferase 61 family protein [Cyanobacteriota bacterium]
MTIDKSNSLPLFQGQVLLREGDYQQAAFWLAEAVESQPTDPLHHWLLGIAHTWLGQAWQAQWIWQSYLQTYPEADSGDLIQVLLEEASYQEKKGNLPQAELLYQQIIEVDPEHSFAFYCLGILCVQFKEFDQALDYFRQATIHHSQFSLAFREWGLALQKIGRFDEAISCLQKAIDLGEHSSQVWFHLGVCWLERQRYPQAIACFRVASQWDPVHPDVFWCWGDAWLKLGEWAPAYQCFRQAVQLDNDFLQAFLVAHAWKSNGREPHALSVLILRDLFSNSSLQTREATPESLTLSADWQRILSKHPDFVGILQASPNHIVPTQHASEMPPQLNIPLIIKGSLQPNVSQSFPKGGYRFTEEWFIAQKRGNYQPIEPAHRLTWIRPNTADPCIQDRLRNFSIDSPATFVVRLPNARAHVGHYQTPQASFASAVITEDEYLLGDLSPCLPPPEFLDRPHANLEDHPLLTLSFLPPLHQLAGTMAVFPLGAVNYFHWMIDVLPSMLLLINSGIPLEQIDYFWLHGYQKLPFQQSTLQRLGIPSEKIIDARHPAYQHIQADQLVVPSLAGYVSTITAPACQKIRNLWLTESQQKEDITLHQRYYISRKKAKWRRLINEPEILACLEPYGFQVLQSEDLSLTDQITLFNQAEAVMGLHGAGLTNILFCRPHTKVIEIFPSNAILPYFWTISCQLDLDYFCLTGQVTKSAYLPSFLKEPDFDREDTWVNPRDLLAVLAQANLT